MSTSLVSNAGGPWECGKVVDGLPILIPMDGFSGIVDFIKVEDARMTQDRFLDGSRALDQKADFDRNYAIRFLPPIPSSTIRLSVQ